MQRAAPCGTPYCAGRVASSRRGTSNPRAGDVQDLVVDTAPLYETVARIVHGWARPASCGLVVAATDPAAAARVAVAAPDLWLLAPGLGAQGGDPSAMAHALGPGAQLLIERDGSDVADVDWARKNDLAGRQFIQHTLAIADVRVALQRAIRERPGFQLLEP